MSWIKVLKVEDIPQMGSRIVKIQNDEIAIFKTRDNLVFAVDNECPHKQGKLSEGLVHDHAVTCPLHNWDINLETGEAMGNDIGCTKKFDLKVEEGVVYLSK